MDDKPKYGPPSVYPPLVIGKAINDMHRYMGKYEITFQFWGEDYNQVFISKDGVDLFESGSHKDPMMAIMVAIDYLSRINKDQ